VLRQLAEVGCKFCLVELHNGLSRVDAGALCKNFEVVLESGNNFGVLPVVLDWLHLLQFDFLHVLQSILVFSSEHIAVTMMKVEFSHDSLVPDITRQVPHVLAVVANLICINVFFDLAGHRQRVRIELRIHFYCRDFEDCVRSNHVWNSLLNLLEVVSAHFFDNVWDRGLLDVLLEKRR